VKISNWPCQRTILFPWRTNAEMETQKVIETWDKGFRIPILWDMSLMSIVRAVPPSRRWEMSHLHLCVFFVPGSCYGSPQPPHTSSQGQVLQFIKCMWKTFDCKPDLSTIRWFGCLTQFISARPTDSKWTSRSRLGILVGLAEDITRSRHSYFVQALDKERYY